VTSFNLDLLKYHRCAFRQCEWLGRSIVVLLDKAVNLIPERPEYKYAPNHKSLASFSKYSLNWLFGFRTNAAGSKP